MKKHCKNNSKKGNKKCICCNKTVVTITILALLIVSTALIYAIQNSLNQVDTPPSNGGGVVVGEGDEIDTSDWLTYTNEELNLSFKYPQEWKIEKPKKREKGDSIVYRMKVGSIVLYINTHDVDYTIEPFYSYEPLFYNELFLGDSKNFLKDKLDPTKSDLDPKLGFEKRYANGVIRLTEIVDTSYTSDVYFGMNGILYREVNKLSNLSMNYNTDQLVVDANIDQFRNSNIYHTFVNIFESIEF